MNKKRSNGQATNRQGRSKTEHRHLQIYHYMMDCPAWQYVSGDGWKVITELMRRHNGKNNGVIPLSIREAAQLLGKGKTAAMNALRDAQAKGFIEKMFAGGIGSDAKAAEWRLTMFECWGKLATKEYMSWRLPNDEK